MPDIKQKEIIMQIGDDIYVEDKSTEKVEVIDDIMYINKFFRKEEKLENIIMEIIV